MYDESKPLDAQMKVFHRSITIASSVCIHFGTVSIVLRAPNSKTAWLPALTVLIPPLFVGDAKVWRLGAVDRKLLPSDLAARCDFNSL